MERLPKETLLNAINTYKTVIEAVDGKDTDYCPVLDKVTVALLEELKSYRDAEEQGLLFTTPFKIGQPICFVGNELVNDYVIRQFIVTEEGVEAVKISKVIDGKEYWNTFYTEQWLVSVFPSKEEAEQKLESMKGEK